MSFKRFISGVSAFAVAVTAFAAMTVTASAMNYGPTDYTTQANKTTVNKSNWDNNGIFTAKAFENGGYAGAYLNFSSLKDISQATSVTLEFDACVYSGTVTFYGFGDASVRSSIMTDENGDYKNDGLAMCFGYNGTAYGARDIKTNATLSIGSSYYGKRVHAKFIFSKTAKKYYYNISDENGTKIIEGTTATNISNLTYIDAYTNKSEGQFGLRKVKVSYTVPDPTVKTTEVTFVDPAPDDSVSARAFTSEITSKGTTFNTVTVEVDKQKKDLSLGTKITTNGSVKIGIILASYNAERINSINLNDLIITTSYE